MITLTMTPTLRAICAHANTLEIDGAIFVRAELVDLLEELKASNIAAAKAAAKWVRFYRLNEHKDARLIFAADMAECSRFALRLNNEINHLNQKGKEIK